MSNDEPPDRLPALYAAGSEQWIHAEQMRWTILYNFLVGNTVLLVAWSTLFVSLISNSHSVGLKIVLIGFCVIGIGGSIVWTFLVRRSNQFSERYFATGVNLERMLLPPDSEPVGPFCISEQHRGSGGPVKTHVVLMAVPIVFGAVYLALMIVSIFAAAERL